MKSQQRKMMSKVLTAVVILFSAVPLAAAAGGDIGIQENVSLRVILEKMKGYSHNQDHAAVLALRNYIRGHRQTEQGRADCERELLAFLRDASVSPDGRWEACRLLRTVGSDASVPVLAQMLEREESANMARYALEKIPGIQAERALLEALGRSSGTIRLGIISSLGHRGTRRAVGDLADIAGGQDRAAAEAAVTALGGIATEDAALSLLAVLGSCPEPLRASVAASLLNCADRLRASGEPDEAFRFYQQILGLDISLSASRAALQGQIAVSGTKGRDLILDVLKNPEPEMHTAAIAMIPEVFTNEDVQPLCEMLRRVPAASRVQLLTALSGFTSDLAMLAAVQALSDKDSMVRLNALRSLEKLGNASIVKPLVRHAAQVRGAEQAAARTTLYVLSGPEVDQAVLSCLEKETEPGRIMELLRCVGERRIAAGRSQLFKNMRHADRGVRIRAVRALGSLSTPSDLPRLLDLLLDVENQGEREETASTVAITARKINRDNARARLITQKLAQAKDTDERVILLAVLGKIGDDSSLPVLRRTLQSSDLKIQEAAARAIIDWPTPTAREDVLYIAETSQNPTLQVLAVRAYVRLVELERYLRPEAAVASLKSVLPLVKRPEEKMAVLGALPRFSCREALAVAEVFLEDESVREEAEAAVKQLRSSLRRRVPVP
jgi:HEAT repeat protein